MIEIPELSESPSRAELVAWYDALEKICNDELIKAIARDKLKKAQRKVSAPRARG